MINITKSSEKENVKAENIALLPSDKRFYKSFVLQVCTNWSKIKI